VSDEEPARPFDRDAELDRADRSTQAVESLGDSGADAARTPDASSAMDAMNVTDAAGADATPADGAALDGAVRADDAASGE
jgi:hypothetical protein